jgi:putative oxidoreductase
MRPDPPRHRLDPRLLSPEIGADGAELSRSWDETPPAPDGEDMDMPSLREIDDVIDLVWSRECRDCPLCRTYAPPVPPADPPASAACTRERGNLAPSVLSPHPRRKSVMTKLLRWPLGDGGPAPAATILVRLAVGGVFVASGAIKFLYANQGVGRFAKLGLPAPGPLANFVAAVEVVAGLLLLVGLATRLAAVPLVVDMLAAIGVSKLPMLFGPGPEPVAAAPKVGFWAFAYQARLDTTMLLCALFLLVAGAGAWSLDAMRARRARGSIREVGDDERTEFIPASLPAQSASASA